MAFFKIWPAISRGNIITIGYVGNYSLEQIPTTVLALATQSLISQDKEGKPIPTLASHWTVSPDHKTYVVFLRDNLKWHDETTVEAKDISIAITNVEISALNNKTIQFSLPNPISSFPQALDKPVFKTNSFYGTGDFRIIDIDEVDNIVKKITLHPKNKQQPRVEIKFYQSSYQAQNALKIGEIKVLNVANAAGFENWPNLEVNKTIDSSEIVTIFYNTSDSLLSSKDLRQALSHAINRQTFDGPEAYGPIATTSWVYNQNVKRYDYNVGRAKELFAKIEMAKPEIVLTVTESLLEVAQKIKGDWEALGIKVQIKEEGSVPDNFQALLAISKIPADPDQYSLWHSSQTKTNITKYKNLKVDKLLEDARTLNTEPERKELYLEFQKSLVEDSPATFLYNPNKYEVIYKNTKSLYGKLSI
jgi:peptide/nickel transport system substrate-binding protein